MPEHPHEYTVRKRWASDDDFAWAVQYIREHGYDGIYGGRKYRYLDVGGFTYWTMGAPMATTILINRAPTATPSGVNVERRQNLA